MFPSVVIFVPLYKTKIVATEQVAFRQLLRVLAAYPIYFCYPTGLDLSVYKDLLNEHGAVNYEFHDFAPSYFQGIAGYNRLLTSLDLYDLLQQFDYFLIYQLDAYVFRDDLPSWLSQGWDYIGAAWLENYDKATPDAPLIGVGNGGFSLRNIKKSHQILLKLARCRKYFAYLFIFVKWGLLRKDQQGRLVKWWMGIAQNPTTDFVLYAIDNNTNEDHFWATDIPRAFAYKVATVEQAIRFSFEVCPSRLYKMNQQQLPFGCHAWEKYEPDFWAKFIS